MTDYTDLIERLRGVNWHSLTQAADAIQHLMAEIDVLDDAWKRDKERIAELEDALKPLADSAIYVDEIDFDFPIKVKAIHLRNAKAALEKGDD